MIIVNKTNGQRVRNVRGRRAIWADGAVTEAARPGIEHGDEIVCQLRQVSIAGGPASRVASEAFDGDQSWVITRERYTPDPAPLDAETKIARVRAEAERRIELGVRIGGIPFRCDTQSIARIQSLMTSAQRAEAVARPVTVKFKTAAGDCFELTSAAEAEAIFDAASAHVAAVLGRSADIQADMATATDIERAHFDETADSNWPD